MWLVWVLRVVAGLLLLFGFGQFAAFAATGAGFITVLATTITMIAPGFVALGMASVLLGQIEIKAALRARPAVVISGQVAPGVTDKATE